MSGERVTTPDAHRQVRVGNEVSAERDGVSVPRADHRLGLVGLEPACRNERPLKDLPKLRGRDRSLAFGHHHVTLHPRLDDEEVSVSGVDLRPVEARGLRASGGFPVAGDRPDLIDRKGAVGRGLQPAAGG